MRLTLFLSILALVLATLFMLAAIAFTVAPILPGGLFIIPGILVYGLVYHFTPFSKWFWIGQIVLTLVFFFSDNIAQAFGLKKMGGSKAGMIGGAIGMFVMPMIMSPLGLLAVFIGPVTGAVVGSMIGEIIKFRRTQEVMKVGFGAVLSYFLGVFLKMLIVCVQIAWFYLTIF